MKELEAKQSWVLYDGECPFCRNLARLGHSWSGPATSWQPYQQAGKQFPGIPPREVDQSLHLVEPGGEVYKGAEAVFRLLARRRFWGWPLALYNHLPGFAWASEALYRAVARHRRILGQQTGAASGKKRPS